LESNWRFNRWLLGLPNTYGHLFARLVVNPAIYLSDASHNFGGFWGISQPTPGVDFWERMYQILPTPPYTTFPYGVNVDPD
jgi:hypothetical protein